MTSETLALADGGAARLVRPEAANPPCVVLLPAIAGVNPYIERVQASLAEAGYAVAAVDYWARVGGPPDLSSPEMIMAAVGSVSDRQVGDDVISTCDALAADGGIDAGRRALVGFCIGGSLAMLAAANAPGFGCVTAFYGLLRYGELSADKPISPLDAASDLDTPFLGHWGDADHLVPIEDVRCLQGCMAAKPAEIYVYPGAGHAFHEDFRPVYRPVAAAEAWRRTLCYFDWHLKGIPG